MKKRTLPFILLCLSVANSMALSAEVAEISDAESFFEGQNASSVSGIVSDSFSDDPEFFKLDSERLLEDKRNTVLMVKTNVQGASVYLNGNYQGTTPLTIKNLTEGRYRLRVEKTHYETRELYVRVRRGQERVYYIDLDRITGRLSFTVSPSNATITCDGFTVYENPMTLDEGTHPVSVKCFGYNTWSSSVQVYRNMLRRIHVELDEADFAITAISSSRTSFNPRNAGTLGQTEIQFSVTTPASGTLTISNANGAVVWSTSYASFSTWNYSAVWNGVLQDGMYAPDGYYTATLTAEDKIASCSFAIDSSISYPQLSITYGGTGLGSVASAQMYPADAMILHFSLGPAFETSNGSLYGAPFAAQFAWTITKWFETSFSYNVMLGSLKTASGSMALKFGSSIPVGFASDFCFAVNMRAGFTQDALFAPYGADIGTGLGVGAILGIDTGSFYAGVESEFIYGPVKGMLTKGNDLSWKNGLMMQYRSTSASIGLYSSLNSCFGSYSFSTYKDDTVYTGAIGGWFRALDSGMVGMVYFPGSSVSAVVKGGALWYPSASNELISEDQVYAYGTLGITIVF